jgi:hypothetical protein
MDPIEQVRAFAEATDLEGKWNSARQLMSSKVKPNGEDFYSLLQEALENLGLILTRSDLNTVIIDAISKLEPTRSIENGAIELIKSLFPKIHGSD